VFNVPPQGCHPYILTLFEWRSPTKDDFGCLTEYNNVVQAFNDELTATVSLLQQTFPTTNFLMFDYYTAMIEILTNLETYGKQTKSTCLDSKYFHDIVKVL
jgi:hypothetical protein